VAVLQIRISKGALDASLGIEDEQFIAGGDVDVIAVDGDAAQPAIAASPGPVDVDVVPVHQPTVPAGFEVHEVDAAMAFALMRRTNNGCGNDGGQGWHWGVAEAVVQVSAEGQAYGRRPRRTTALCCILRRQRR